MHRKFWFWLLVGWLASLLVSPRVVTGMFTAKKA